MITFDDFKRLTNTIQNKIFLLVGRAIVTYINNSTDVHHQKVQISVLKNEVLSNVERIQEYGFETYPYTNSEAVCLFLAGDRKHGIVITIGDRRYRLTDLTEGEVAIYTSEDQETEGHRIHLKSGQNIDIRGTSVTINCNVTVTGGDISTDGDIQDGNITTPTMVNMRTMYNTHTHPFTNAHGTPSVTDSTSQTM
jgi:phage baseplate assembly protein V